MPLRVVDVIFRFNYCTDLPLLAGDGADDDGDGEQGGDDDDGGDDGDGEQGGGVHWSGSQTTSMR